MNMLENVAKAIWSAGQPFSQEEWDAAPPFAKQLARDRAMWALEGMKEPTPAVKVAGGLKMEAMLFENDPDYSGVIFEDCGVIFAAMIDAAIQEGK